MTDPKLKPLEKQLWKASIYTVIQLDERRSEKYIAFLEKHTTLSRKYN